MYAAVCELIRLACSAMHSWVSVSRVKALLRESLTRKRTVVVASEVDRSIGYEPLPRTDAQRLQTPMPSTQTHTRFCSLLVAGTGADICTCVGCVTLATCAVAYISLYWEAPLRQVPFPPEASPQVVFKPCMCVCVSVFVCRRERDKDGGRKVHLSTSF